MAENDGTGTNRRPVCSPIHGSLKIKYVLKPGVKKMLRVDQLKSLGAWFQRDTRAELKLQEGQWLFFTHTL